MDALKKIGGWIAGGILLVIVGYNFTAGWLINPPQPRIVMDQGKVWVAEPASPFLHYLFGSEILRETRVDSATGQYEYKKDGNWISLPAAN